MFSAVGGVVTAGGILSLYAGSRDLSGHPATIPIGVFGLAVGTLYSAIASWLWATYARGAAWKRPAPAAVSVSRGDSGSGLGWTF